MVLERFMADIKFSDRDGILLKHAALEMWRNTGKPVEECWFQASVNMLVSKGLVVPLTEAEMLQDGSKLKRFSATIDEESKQLRLPGV
jgi:hypothetical protein